MNLRRTYVEYPNIILLLKDKSKYFINCKKEKFYKKVDSERRTYVGREGKRILNRQVFFKKIYLKFISLDQLLGFTPFIHSLQVTMDICTPGYFLTPAS